MQTTQPPPRLLLGATLLFWGAMTGRPFIGLLVAIVVESPQWLRWRWDFDDAAIARAWQLALMLCVGLLVLMLIDGEREQLMPILISWLPALMLPMQLSQTFGLRSSIPLGALSFFAARRRERNMRLGIEQPEVVFHFGNAYFVVVLISAALGVWAEARLFLPGLLILCAWRFLTRPGRRTIAVVVVFVCSGLIAILGQTSLNRLYDWFSRGGHSRSNWMSDATHGFTAIGAMRDLKLSSEIRWRLSAEAGEPPPSLLRRAVFNRYRGTNWEITQLPQGGGADAQFIDLDIIEPELDEAYYLANPMIEDTDAISDQLRRFSMRGSTRPGGAMPLPGSVASFKGFDLDSAQRNPLSTVRIFPAAPVIDGVVLWQAENHADGEPIWHDDLRLPPLESAMIRRVAQSIGLHDATSTREKMALIKNWFQEEFSYTLYLAMEQPTRSIGADSAIGRFLEETRRGHCEYFATAATLLMRSVNIPTRYTTGYAVIERDARRNEFIIRGIHGHAWCRVWLADEKRWVDFDPTPSDWAALEQIGQIAWSQRLLDTLQRLREDLFIWRSDPDNRERLLMIIIIPGIIGAFWIGFRLWRSKHKDDTTALRRSAGQGQPSPLFTLESVAKRHLGPRPESTPYAAWLLRLAGELNGHSVLLNQAITLHQRIRFDPQCGQGALFQQLQTMTRELRPAISELATRR